MARKELITRDKILETAFSMAENEGIEHVTARKLASEIGCSTQPIFRVYTNMNELYTEMYQKALDAYAVYYENYKSQVNAPFIHLGLAYINYAREKKMLFQFLFQSEYREKRTLFELLNGKSNAVTQEINRAVAAGCIDPDSLFRKILTVMHGCACMVLTGDYDLSEEETVVLLKDTYKNCLRSLT